MEISLACVYDEPNHQSLTSSLEWSQIQDIGFYVHLGRYDSKTSVDIWNERICSLQNDTIPAIIINLELATGDKSKEAKLFAESYDQLSESVKAVLRLENDAEYFTVSDVVTISEKIGIPVVINLYNDMKYPSSPLNESIDRIIKSMPSKKLEFSFDSTSGNLEIKDLKSAIKKLHHYENLTDQSINLIAYCENHAEIILEFKKYIEHERLQEEFLGMVDSKLRKSEKEIWFNPDHDHMDKHLKG